MGQTTQTVHKSTSAHRLISAERRGLRLGILCRTIALAVASVWWFAINSVNGLTLSPWTIGVLLAMMAFGVVAFLLIGTRFDRGWLKYAIYAADILGVCAAFALVPLRAGAEIPQIMAFRAYGIHFLFPLIALACLSLSWRLVLWSGFVAVAGWWAAYLYVIRDMPVRLHWSDLPEQHNLVDYERIILSINFVGQGSRIIETGTLFIAAAILAFAVYRARQVFFAQLKAESEREAEREMRERITSTLGRYVPETIALRLIKDASALVPQERFGVMLIADIADFTRFAADRSPTEVISRLNDFLGQAATAISSNDGIVIQFTGDGLLATFNAPIEIDQPERAAFTAAKALLGIAESAGFSIRVGLAAGPIAAGSIGSSNRQAFTVYGDTVNRGARLETLGKHLNASIIFDETCATAIECEAAAPGGAHHLPGLTDTVPVWVYPKHRA